eukprot:gene12147-14213_t
MDIGSEKDEGMVVVGGRLDPVPNELNREHVVPAVGIDLKIYLDDDVLDPDTEAAAKEEDEDHNHGDAEGVKSDTNHFSFYALNAKTGAKLWAHEDGDFMPKNSHADEDHHGSKVHSFRQHIYSQIDHIGEVSWKAYKTSVFSALPHRWSSNFDTRFDVRHFTKPATQLRPTGPSQTGGAGSPDAWNAELVGLHPLHFGGILPTSADRSPHNEEDHVVEPNVVVAHTRQGLEVIHLHTGRTLTTLVLDGTNAHKSGDHFIVYMDLNGDGMLDQVHAMAGDLPGSSLFSRSRKQEICVGMGLTGLPPRDYLFNRSICSAGGSDFDYFFWRNGDMDGNTNTGVQTVSPAIIVDPTSIGRTEHDVVFLVNSGRITSVKFNGSPNWQVDTGAKWHKNDMPRAHASIQPFSIEVSGNRDSLLAIAETMVVLSRYGDILVEIDLAVDFSASTSKVLPMAPPVVGDFNNDGQNDIIVATLHGFHAYQMTRGYSTMLFTLIGLMVMVVFILLLVIGGGFSHSASTSITNQKLFTPAKKLLSSTRNITFSGKRSTD